MHLEFLVEEESAEAALQNLVPKIVGPGISFAFHVHQGKRDLLSKLPGRLRGYRRWLLEDWRIVTLVDEDRQDCKELKTELERFASVAGMRTQSQVPPGSEFQVLNRLAIEELEARFFGDIDALVAAFPKIPKALGKRSRFRNPDAIKGGTWEALEQVMKEAGYYPSGLPKIEVARKVSEQMVPDRNRSRSFQIFREGLKRMMV